MVRLRFVGAAGTARKDRHTSQRENNPVLNTPPTLWSFLLAALGAGRLQEAAHQKNIQVPFGLGGRHRSPSHEELLAALSHLRVL